MLHQAESVPTVYERLTGDAETAHAALRLQSKDETNGPVAFSFEAVRDGIFRTTFAAGSHPLPPFPSARPLEADESLAGCATVSSDETAKTWSLTSNGITANVDWSHAPVISLSLDGVDKPIYTDLKFRSYALDGPGVAHYATYNKGTLYIGLGEKAAPMNLAGRSFQITASDTFGYDSRRTDPLYKHIPLLINVTPRSCVGIFSTSHSRGTWSIGSEIDGLWGPYKVYRHAHGGLEEYLIVGKTVAEVVRRYADLVGYPLLVPRYMMGYLGGGMKYSMLDDPPANEAILEFLDNCAKHDIPISAFQMSSGYTVAETEPKTRNVFTWNRHRFPDPRAYTREAHSRGVKILANVKPYVLANHPAYDELAKAGAFFTDPRTGKAGVARLWSAGGGESGEGSHLDFTSKAGYEWWYEGCRGLKEVGIDGIWNDNNEFTIPRDDWECALDLTSTKPDILPIPQDLTRKDVSLWGRAMHTELMGRASATACASHAPSERPLVLTRSATAGTMRHACASWGGDNVTSWSSMMGGNALTLNAGVSLIPCYSHDTGGFEGPQPDAELLVRWIQMAVHSPRLTINCFKTRMGGTGEDGDNLVGDVIEPWMYPSATGIIRKAIKRRYELVPYVYSALLKARETAVPVVRWTGWGCEGDEGVWNERVMDGEGQYWFGDALLVAGVGKPGEETARVYLPRVGGYGEQTGDDLGYVDTRATASPESWFEAGMWHSIRATWQEEGIPILARVGSAVPVGKDHPTRCRQEEDKEFPNIEKDDWRGVEIWPPVSPASRVDKGYPRWMKLETDRKFTTIWFEDDGISSADKVEVCEVQIEYEVTGSEILVTVTATQAGDWEPLWLHNGVDVILPVWDERAVKTTGGNTSGGGKDARGRPVWHIPVAIQGRSTS